MEPQRKAAILAALDAGRSLNEIAAELAPPEEKTLSDEIAIRASLVDRFDKKLYEAVLATNLDSAPETLPFSEFIQRPDVEDVPRSSSYRFSDSDRAKWAALCVEPQRSELRRRLVEHFEALGPAAELDLMEQLIELDPAQALERLKILFRQADAAFDNALFESLLRLISKRTAPGFTQLYAAQYRRLRARSLFVDDFYQTIVFYPRPEAVAKIDDLLNPDSESWIMLLHERGGAGKTMFLRWLAARRLVAEQGIPVASIDLDDYRLDIAAQYPWLLWLPLLQQWKEQIPQTGLESIFMSYRDFLPLLYRTGSTENTDRLEEEFSSVAQGLLANLRLALSSAFQSLDRPVVAIIDTVEEASLHRPQILVSGNPAVPGIVDTFANLRILNMRLILSGRYDLLEPDRLPLFSQRYASVTVPYSPPGFTNEETKDYLRVKRRITDDSIIEAIAEKGQGAPFRISLLADLHLGGELKSAADVHAANEDFVYLIERVVKRIIEPEVRWIVRYGVLPRTLDKQFVTEVMLPHLRREIPGDEYDRPDRRFWTAATPDPDKGWQRLMNYATAYGWVKPSGGALQFGPEVRTPLRRLLRPEKVFSLLHQDAAAWFARRAVADPGNWVRWKSEEIYHLLQLDLERGLDAWRQTLSEGDAPDLAARWSIAQLLFDRDLLETGQDGEQSPSPEVLAEAHFELAAIAAQQASLGPDGAAGADKWAAAEREFRAGTNLLPSKGSSILEPASRCLIEASILMGQGRYLAAVERQHICLGGEIDSRYRVALLVQLGGALYALGKDGAPVFMEARELALTLPHPWIQPREITRRLVQKLLERYDLLRLRTAYGWLLDELDPAAPEYESTLLGYAMHALLPAGDIRSGARILADRGLDAGKHRFAAPYILGELSLRERSLASARHHNNSAMSATNSSGIVYWQGMAFEQKGRIEAGLLDLTAALASFSSARDRFESSSAATDAAVAKMRMSDATFEICGDTERALKFLFDVSDEQLNVQPFLRTLWLARAVRLYNVRGEERESLRRWEQLKIHLLQIETHPAFRVIGWSAAAANGFGGEETAAHLRDALEAVQPERARISLVEFFRWADRAHDFLAALPDLPEPDLADPDWAMQQVCVADYDRARGRIPKAISRLESTWERLGDSVELPVWLTLMRAQRRAH